MLNWLRNLFASPARPVVSRARHDALLTRYAQLRSKYDAAQNSEDTRRHWAAADGLSAKAANTLTVRKKLRERARLEYDNNGYCGGMIRTMADDIIGTGPTLQAQTSDAAFNAAVESRFWEWAKQCGAAEAAGASLGEVLHTGCQAKKKDGEAFIMAAPGAGDGPLGLGLRLFECDQITTPDPKLYNAQNYCDGIVFDNRGRPQTYHLLRDHPGDDTWRAGFEYDSVPAENMIHVFRRDRAGQVRGIPEIASVLLLYAELRRFTRATLRAAEIAAELGAVLLETEASANTGDEPNEENDFDTLDLSFGMMTALPANVKAKQMAPEHPSTTYPMFKGEILKETGRPVSMPANIVTGTSAGYNFSSARMDCLLYRNSITVERELVWTLRVLERIWTWWIKEAATIEGYLPPLPAGVEDYASLPHAWMWPGFPLIDPQKEAQADALELENGTTTLADLCAQRNKDWEAVMRQRAREQALAKELGVTLGKPAAAAPEPSEAPPDEDDDEDDEQPVESNGHIRNGAVIR